MNSKLTNCLNSSEKIFIYKTSGNLILPKEADVTAKLTWYGHAAMALETGGYKLAIDPFLEGNPAASLSPDAVDADFILISHGHGVQVGVELANATRTGASVIRVTEHG